MFHRLLWIAVLLTNVVRASAQDVPSPHIRATEPLTPEEQLLRFHVPPGFEVQLVAAEPDIQKPMNLAFDAAGRLWVSGSVEYPFAAAEGQGQDTIRILEDTDGDGRADKYQTFAEGLNIPIGLYPYQRGVVAYSIPSIVYFEDLDGDERADRHTELFGPLGDPVDTHGLQNAFRRGFDGWMYACHGFRNDSVITGSDGSRIELNSGNTYRIRLDGSRVEQFTWGQVNPFGSTITPQGDLITADCHSKPLTRLLWGGTYTSFGKPHDGLGFVPAIMGHGHGSTAICGAAFYADDRFPAEYRDCLYVGNVITSRVHRDSVRFVGSTMQAHEEPDFVTCDDPWFRPVDLQVGPDGALYIADFYNRIIGHYEVPLDHPGRDRSRGRIWRVVHRDAPAPERISLAHASVDQLLEEFCSPSLSRRMLAMDQLSDRAGGQAVGAIRAAVRNTNNPRVIVHGLWVLHRLSSLSLADYALAAAHADTLVRIHAMRLLAAAPNWSGEHLAMATRGLGDREPTIQRAAAEALGQHQDKRAVSELLEMLPDVPVEDTHLRHTIRIALRNQLRAPQVLEQLGHSELTDASRRELGEIALAVPTEAAAMLLVENMRQQIGRPVTLAARLKHVAMHSPPHLIDDVVKMMQTAGNFELQAELLQDLVQQVRVRQLAPTGELREWGLRLARSLLGSIDPPSDSWANTTLQNPWGLESRKTSRGAAGSFLSSLPGGERQTGRLRSREFSIPSRLSFELCGYGGNVQHVGSGSNYVRLRLASSGAVLQTAHPPDSDQAKGVTWRLEEHAGQAGYLEVVDGMNQRSFAWLAVGELDPTVVRLPTLSPQVVARRQTTAAQIARALTLGELSPTLREQLLSSSADPGVRAAAAEALLALTPHPVAGALVSVLGYSGLSDELRTELVAGIADPQDEKIEALVKRVMQVVPSAQQEQVALALASQPSGGSLLLRLAEEGTAAPQLLQRPVLVDMLSAAGVPQARERVTSLTRSIPTSSAKSVQMIRRHGLGYLRAQTNVARGRVLFEKHCSACHQLEGKGTVIGPQLDGIGNRGLERVLEDLLDPHRNIDAAFHISVLLMDDGRVVQGLFRRQEGPNQVFANAEGKEFSLTDAGIEQQQRIRASLMPDNFATLLQPSELYDLLAYLMEQRQSIESPESASN